MLAVIPIYCYVQSWVAFYSNNTLIRLTLPFSFNSAFIQRVSHFVFSKSFFLQYLSVNFKWKLMTLNYSKNSILKYSSGRHYLVFIWQECILSELPDQLSWLLHSTLQAYTCSAKVQLDCLRLKCDPVSLLPCLQGLFREDVFEAWCACLRWR